MRNHKTIFLLLIIALVSTLFVFSTQAQETETVYVNEINKTVTAGSGTIFTKAFNNTNVIKADSSEGNFIWAAVITAEPTETAGIFRVTFTKTHFQATEEVTIPEGGFVYSAHVDDSQEAQASGLLEKSSANFDKLISVQVGDLMTLSGIDLTAGTIATDAVIFLGEVQLDESEVSTPEETSPEETIPEESPQETSIDVPATGDSNVFTFAITIFTALFILGALATVSIKKRNK